MQSSNWTTSRGHYLILALLVLCVAFALRMWDIEGRSLWFDEAMEVSVARSNLAELPANVRDGLQDPPLYSLGLHMWLQFGAGDLHVRFPSVLFSLVGIASVMAIARHHFGSGGALIAGALMAVMPSQIRYAQEAGQYALMGAGIALNLLILSRMRGNASWRVATLWWATAVFCVYSYYGSIFSVLLPFGFELGKAVVTKNANNQRKGVVALGAFGLAIAPLIMFFLPQQLFRGPTANAFQLQVVSAWDEIARFFTESARLVAFQFTGWPWSETPEWIAPGVVFGAILLQRKRAPLLGWLALVWVANYAAGRIGLFPFGFRYGLILTPLLVALLGQTLPPFRERRIKRMLTTLAFGVLFALSLSAYPGREFRDRTFGNLGWAWPETEDMRPTMAFWNANRASGQATYVYYGAAPAFSYYGQSLAPEPAGLPPMGFARCWQADAPSYCNANGVRYGLWIRNLSTEAKIASIRSTLGGEPDEVWIVFGHVNAREDTQILAEFLTRYSIRMSRQSTNASAYLLSRR